MRYSFGQIISSNDSGLVDMKLDSFNRYTLTFGYLFVFETVITAHHKKYLLYVQIISIMKLL